MDQIKERCIYCGADVYYTGAEALIKCGMCGHTLVVAKFENELAKINAAIQEGEAAKHDLEEARREKQAADDRLFAALTDLSEIRDDQDVLGRMICLLSEKQDNTLDRLQFMKEISERLLNSQSDIFARTSLINDIALSLQKMHMEEHERQSVMNDFMHWSLQIHAEDIDRLQDISRKADDLYEGQKAIIDKMDALEKAADQHQKTLEAFQGQYTKDRLEELQQLYRQAQNYQFDRAYDKAYDKYEQIVIKGGGDAAVLWHMILCHYCVSYQENDEGEMIPIIMNPDITDPDEMSLRLDFENMLNDSSLVTEEQVEVYRHELDKIDSILDEYRHVRHQENYDIFISVKQDEDGHYTYDSDFAADLYYYLISKGYKVFNSRISKIPAGEEYEPYIISALLSARVMIVVGTCAENMNAAWVKNEWSRFQWIQQSEKRSKGETDRLLLCYLAKGMQPRDLPKALNPNCQAIVESVDSGDILSETLDDIFRRGRFRQKAFLTGKKQSKPAADRNKTEKDTKKTTQTPVSKKEASKPLKEDAGLKSVPTGNDDEDKSGEDTRHVPAAFSGKWVIGIAATAVLVVVLALSRLGSGAQKVDISGDETNSVIGIVESESAISETESSARGGDEESSVPETEVTTETEAEKDYAIDWKDESLEANMRAITGIKDREIMYSDVKDMTMLDLSLRVRIKDISALANLTNLKKLDLSNNSISDIDSLSNLTNLTELDLGFNDINDISSLGNLTSLTTLHLDDNQITDISILGNLTNLTTLNIDRNQISDIRILKNLTNLQALYLGGNQISDISSLGNLTDLTKLYLYKNQISDISILGNLTDLTELDLGDNQISDISILGDLTNLTTLHLDDNQISDIGILGDLTNLIELYLGGNQISDISILKNLTNLKELKLKSNQISDISALKNLKKLEMLNLEDNPISDYSPIEELVIQRLFI